MRFRAFALCKCECFVSCYYKTDGDLFQKKGKNSQSILHTRGHDVETLYNYVVCVGRAQWLFELPALDMVTAKGLAGKVLIPAAGIAVVFFLDHSSLGILLEIGHVVRSVSPLEYSIDCRRLLGALPDEITTKRFGELSREHVASCGTWRESSLLVVGMDRGDDGLRSRSWDLINRLQLRGAGSPLHHQWAVVGVVR